MRALAAVPRGTKYALSAFRKKKKYRLWNKLLKGNTTQATRHAEHQPIIVRVLTENKAATKTTLAHVYYTSKGT